MRQVIRRFLNDLEAEKNASPATAKSYQHDLLKFHGFLVQRMGPRFLPGDVARDDIRDYLLWLAEIGHKRPNLSSKTCADVRTLFPIGLLTHLCP